MTSADNEATDYYNVTQRVAARYAEDSRPWPLAALATTPSDFVFVADGWQSNSGSSHLAYKIAAALGEAGEPLAPAFRAFTYNPTAERTYTHLDTNQPILNQIPNFVHLEAFVFVRFDLQAGTWLPLSQLLHNLAKEIVERLHLSQDKVTLPAYEELEKGADVFADNFLPQVYEALGGKNLVLLLDEFDA